MYAEDRGLLPYRRNQTYTNNRSLARHRDDIAARLDHDQPRAPVRGLFLAMTPRCGMTYRTCST